MIPQKQFGGHAILAAVRATAILVPAVGWLSGPGRVTPLATRFLLPPNAPSMSDFIREVDEDYRRERASKFLSRYSLLIAVVVVLAVAAAGGWRLWLDHQTETAAQANARYDAAGQLLAQGKAVEARVAFEAVAKEGPAGYVGLAQMRAAQAWAVTDPDGAAKAFDTLASDANLEPGLREAARVRSALIRVDHQDPQAFERQYGPFAAPGFAFRSTMRELLALAAMKRGDYPAAGKYLNEIILDPLAPPNLRNRAQAFAALVQAGPATPSTMPAPAAALTPVKPEPATAPAPSLPLQAPPAAPSSPPQ